MQCAQHEYLRYLLSHPKLIRDFFGQHIHIPAYLVVGDLGINLRGGNMLMS